MENNYWNVECSNCGLSLRLTVKEKDFGKTVEAICPKCRTQTKTTIGVSVMEEELQISPELEQKMMALTEKITTDPEIAAIMESIREEGFGIMFAMGLYERKVAKKVKPQPKVDKDGKVKVGTFTDEDKENFKKFFKIEL
jgi:predicted nucleic-acid-binding Zn-ribbon protein